MLLISYGKPSTLDRNLNEISTLNVLFYSLSRNNRLISTSPMTLTPKELMLRPTSPHKTGSIITKDFYVVTCSDRFGPGLIV